MAYRASIKLRNVLLDALTTEFGGGTAVLEIRNGVQPTNARDAPTGTVLASITLPASPFSAASAAALAKNGTWQDASADAAGTATWFRIRKAGDAGTQNDTDSRLDGSVGQGSGDLSLDNAVIAVGQVVTVTSFAVTQAQ